MPEQYDPNQQPQPYQQPYEQPQPIQPQYQQPYQQPAAAAPAKSVTGLIVLSVIEILFWGGLFAIIPLVFAIQANSAYKIGDIATGDAKAKTAKTALIIIAVVVLVLIILLVATGALSDLS